MIPKFSLVILLGLLSVLVALGQGPVKPPSVSEAAKPPALVNDTAKPAMPTNNSFRLMMIPNGDAHVNVDSQPVRVFLIPKAGNSEGARKAVFSRWCTVAPQQNGKPFYDLDGASLSFTVILPDALPQQQYQEAIKQLGLDEKVTLIPSEVAGLTIRISNSGQHEEMLVQKPTATSQLPTLLPVSANLTNEKLLKLLGSKPDQTSVVFEVYARQEAEIRRGFVATRIATAMNDICDRLGLPKDNRKIAVSADVSRKFLSEMSIAITMFTKDFDRDEALNIVKAFSADWDRIGAIDLEKVKAELVIIGNDTLRQNMKLSEFQDLKRKFSEAGAIEKISHACWDIVSAAALESRTEDDFKKHVSKNSSSSSETSLGASAVIKAIPVSGSFKSGNSGSNQSVEDMQITHKDFLAIQTYFKDAGSTYESFKKNHQVTWEGECFAKTFQSNLPDAFSLLETAKLSTKLEIAVSAAESRGDRFVGFQSAYKKLFKPLLTTSSIAKWADSVETSDGVRTNFKALATMELTELPSSAVFTVSAEGLAINPYRGVYRVSTVHAVKDLQSRLNKPAAGLPYDALLEDSDGFTNAARLDTELSIQFVPERKIFVLTFTTYYQSCDNRRSCEMDVAFNIELVPIPTVGLKK